jgi:hypothetical protein
MKHRALFSLVWTAVSIAGCAAGAPCDPDQTFLSTGLCFETDLLTSADAGDSGLAPDAAVCALFGDPCYDTDYCKCATNLCVLRTEDAEGICTHTGCLEQPDLCPSDWSCVDLSPYGADLPSICLPPS